MDTKSSEEMSHTIEKSIEQIKKNNEISIRSMKWLTILFVIVGLIQIQIAVITLFFILRLK